MNNESIPSAEPASPELIWDDLKYPIIPRSIQKEAEDLHRRWQALGGGPMTWQMGAEWMYAVMMIRKPAEPATESLPSVDVLKDFWDKGYVRGCEEAEAKSHGDYGPVSAPNFAEYLRSQNISPAPHPEPSEQSRPDADELWDEFSEHIDDNSMGFYSFGGTSVITRPQFKKLAEKYLSLHAQPKQEDTGLEKRVSDLEMRSVVFGPPPRVPKEDEEEIAAYIAQWKGKVAGEKSLGQTLKEIREEQGLSENAVRQETGISNEYLRKLEKDELKTPSAGVLWKLSQYYEVDLKPLAIKARIIIKAPPSPPSVDHIHVQLPSGGIANVSPDASTELLGALDKMVELAKETDSPPSVKPDESPLIEMLKAREKSVARVADQFPYWEGSRDTFRWLIKHLESEATDNFPDDHLPEIEPSVKPEREEIRCFSCGSINEPDKDGIFRKKCWYCKKLLEDSKESKPSATQPERANASPYRTKLVLPLGPNHRLVRWANAINGFYAAPIYLVGSQITGADDPRDVDVICVLPDEDFELRYGSVGEWVDQGETGLWGVVRHKWSDDCVKKTKHGIKETGLDIDFKILPKSWSEDGYKHVNERFPPVRLDTNPDVKCLDQVAQPSPTEQEVDFKQDFHAEHVEFLSLMRDIPADQSLKIADFIERQNQKISAVRVEKIASLQSQLSAKDEQMDLLRKELADANFERNTAQTEAESWKKGFFDLRKQTDEWRPALMAEVQEYRKALEGIIPGGNFINAALLTTNVLAPYPLPKQQGNE